MSSWSIITSNNNTKNVFSKSSAVTCMIIVVLLASNQGVLGDSVYLVQQVEGIERALERQVAENEASEFDNIQCSFAVLLHT